MPTASAIATSLDREIQKLVRRANASAYEAYKQRHRYEKRSGEAAVATSPRLPKHWSAHPHFNPFYVRARQDSIAHAISRGIRAGTYKPQPSLLLTAEKPDGGYRALSIFTIPDSAVSYWLGHRLSERNAHFFSSYTYAYRRDRNAHHAIQHLMGAIRDHSRLFVLEYDFAKYFDSIDHAYLVRVLKQNGFLVSARELVLIQQLLRNPRASGVEAYRSGTVKATTRGIPQGTTISLFLANVACFELDREIERAGATFARYADDTLIVCESYEKANYCARLLLEHGLRAGTAVNFAKSPGISLLTADPKPELRPTRSVTFLAHSLRSEGVFLSPRAVIRMKRRVAVILYNNLLLQPTRGHVNPQRLGAGYRDWDMVTALNELRRYIYGRVSERELLVGLSGDGPLTITRCALSFFPTLDEVASGELRVLDGWLVDVVLRAHAKRAKLLVALGIALEPLTRDELLSGTWYAYPEIPAEVTLPSFYKSWRYVRRCARVYGLSKFPSPQYGYGA